MTETAPGNRRTTAHDHAQLAEALGWTVIQVGKAVALGLLPPYDLKSPRWRAATVDALVESRDALASTLDEEALLTGDELIALLRLEYADWRRGREHAVIPDPDCGEYWSRALADDLASRGEWLREQIPPQPLGARRCAELLAELTGLEVTDDDLRLLIEQGQVAEVAFYKKWPLYDTAAVRRLGTTAEGIALVTSTVADRQAWLAGSMTSEDTAAWLGCHPRDLPRVAADHGISPGRFGRWARIDIARLTDDEDALEQVRRGQVLGPEQAALHMEIRRRDFDYVVAAGWVAPVRHVTREVGVRKTVDIPLYAIGGLEDALRTQGVDWEAVRAVRAGEASPLREYTRLPAARADTVRAFCAQLAVAWSVEVWPHFDNPTDRWEIDWEQRHDGHPTRAEVVDALAAHRGASKHAEHIVLSTAVGDVIRRARADLSPGAAVVIDTETTDLDGIVVEIAVLDAATGAVLVDTLVHPDGVPVAAGARAVHGITDEALADAPRWADIADEVLSTLAGRRILAYNASFDRARIAATHAHAGLDAGRLPSAEQWDCLMEAQSTWLRIGRWLPLGANHRARGDAAAARRILQQLAAPPDAYRP
ncbi:Exonuclease [Parafrankia irregularis]|uniref:Exonuclease n=1 Tax=Parafrankia irregularis TaxID=795642 RepID=A0A0S4R1X9_9ACTN|nr:MULTISPECIES: 3'-5' exonuclease [Parafrankia]MBE3206659.1 3'-5' exonuclease [Parafrankia sp. CH37]CUU60778.1 Exonuclease [Parafrankia irregularis]